MSENQNVKSQILEHFATQVEGVWDRFAEMMGEGYFSNESVERIFGKEAAEILYDGKVEATVKIVWHPESTLDPEDFTPELVQEVMDRTDSSHICQTSQRGNHYGDWATCVSIENGHEVPNPETVFGVGNERALIFAIAEETVGRDVILEKVPGWAQYFEERPVSTMKFLIERPNTTDKNDVAAYIRSFLRDYVPGIRPNSATCVELNPILPDSMMAILEEKEDQRLMISA